MIGKEIADKITNVSKEESTKELPNNETEEDVEITTPKKRYISPEERKRIIEELRLVPKTYVWIKMHISQRKKANYWSIKVSIIV